ncbi:MAG TPA: M4 family metallopeptidase [Blastocatellia bacterium]|nr:M4 family metallopeptidase [Blastocatellia bacterium]
MKKFLLWSLSLLMTLSAALPPSLVQAQDGRTRNNDNDGKQERVKGSILKTYREDDAQSSRQSEAEASTNQSRKQRPLWVESALQRSLNFLSKPAAPTSEQADGANVQTQRAARDARQDFALVSAEQDDLGFTHVRLNQLRNGVRVFGKQVITHLDAKNMAAVSGSELEAADVETTPAINAADALKAAKAALKFDGKFENVPQAELVLLPHSLFQDDEDKGATLVYHVELQIEDGTDATAHHQYFINAKDGKVVWHFNSLDHGTGFGLYTGGGVAIKTRQTFAFPFFKYSMIDDDRGGATTLNNGTLYEKPLIDVWGNGTNANAESAGVDAHFGMMRTWDYFKYWHGRLGIDGAGYKMVANVHYGTNYNNAFWNGTRITFGDGNGTTFSPLVSMDVVAHEITHGLTQKTAGLIYSKESGALNESFSDIFGTMVEYYSGINPDFLIGEDCYTPATSGDALRSMANPKLYGDPDHYSNRYTGSADNGGVHSNSGIPNNAFYLLAQGGTNSTSLLSVTGIGRAKAAAIFFRALTVYMSASDRMIDARRWTLQAARDLYGLGSAEYNSVAQAWRAVGVPYIVYGAIRAKWDALGAEAGFLGMPTTDELSTACGGGRFNHFVGGSIYWTPATGAQEVHGAIRSKWASLGWECSFLGFPLTDERTTPDGIGRYNHFQGGSIYWTPATGAWEVHGAIRDKWASLGWERSALKYPVSDEQAWGTTGRVSYFQGGRIYWTPFTGAFVIYY